MVDYHAITRLKKRLDVAEANIEFLLAQIRELRGGEEPIALRAKQMREAQQVADEMMGRGSGRVGDPQ